MNAKAQTPAPALTSDDKLSDKLENMEAGGKLALLIRWAQAESSADRCGTEIALERLAWRGVETLCREVLGDIEEVWYLAGTHDASNMCVFNPDVEGGER